MTPPPHTSILTHACSKLVEKGAGREARWGPLLLRPLFTRAHDAASASLQHLVGGACVHGCTFAQVPFAQVHGCPLAQVPFAQVPLAQVPCRGVQGMPECVWGA